MIFHIEMKGENDQRCHCSSEGETQVCVWLLISNFNVFMTKRIRGCCSLSLKSGHGRQTFSISSLNQWSFRWWLYRRWFFFLRSQCSALRFSARLYLLLNDHPGVSTSSLRLSPARIRGAWEFRLVQVTPDCCPTIRKEAMATLLRPNGGMLHLTWDVWPGERGSQSIKWDYWGEGLQRTPRVKDQVRNGCPFQTIWPHDFLEKITFFWKIKKRSSSLY